VPGASDEAVACDAGPGRKLPAERQVSSLLRNVTQQQSDDFVSHIQHGPITSDAYAVIGFYDDESK
jgi:hypothetical protein